jgi:hypothetical protein
MMDQTWTICGLNGQNSDIVRYEGFINPLKTTVCEQWISSTSSLGRYSVHKNDGVSFGKFSSDGIIRFGLYHVLKILCVLLKFFLKFLPR